MSSELSHEEYEAVLLVPSKLTKSAYQTLVQCGFVARPWHLEGRYGSRTHRVSDTQMGLPLLPSAPITMTTAAESGYYDKYKELKDLLETDGVQIVHKPKVPAPINRCCPKQVDKVDATIHMERAPSLTSNCWPQDKLEQKTQLLPAFTFAELFAGIGGFGVALEALGGTCTFCSELDHSCREMYAKNSQSQRATTIHGDIYQVPNCAFPQQLDLLVGGFPCQPFSSLGQQPGFDDPRGNLFLQIVRVLEVSKPKAFLLENVPGLLQTKDSYDTIVAALFTAGYTVTTEICSSRGLTATSRKRLFFVGLRRNNDNGSEPEPFEFPYVPDLGLRAMDVIDYCDKSDGNDEYEDVHSLLRLSSAQMEQLCNSKRWKPAKLAWPDVVCDTLDSHYGVTVGKGNSQLVPCSAPLRPRRFTPRECARIMGFPEAFVLPPKQDDHQGDMAYVKQQYRMFGNAVCPPLVAALSGAVLAHCRAIAGYHNHDDWVVWGRQIAIQLAIDAVLPSRRAVTWTRLQQEQPGLYATVVVPVVLGQEEIMETLQVDDA